MQCLNGSVIRSLLTLHSMLGLCVGQRKIEFVHMAAAVGVFCLFFHKSGSFSSLDSSGSWGSSDFQGSSGSCGPLVLWVPVAPVIPKGPMYIDLKGDFLGLLILQVLYFAIFICE